MNTPAQSQEREANPLSVSGPAFYDLRELARGTSEEARQVSESESEGIHALLSGLAPGLDTEYPSPRQVMQGHRTPVRLREFTLNIGAKDPGPLVAAHVPRHGEGPASQKGVAPERHPAIYVAGEGVGDRGVGPLALVAAAGVGGLIAVGAVLFVLAITDSNAPGAVFAGAALAVGIAASIAVWFAYRTERPSASSRATRGFSPDMWALRVGGSLREAVSVGMRTGGLGLLVRPGDPYGDKAEDADRESSTSDEVADRA